MEDKILVSNIQRFSVDDGPGIRTTVFLKGCSVRCPWCANPENLSIYNQLWFDEKKCICNSSECRLNKNCNRKFAEKLKGSRIQSFENYCPIYSLSPVAKEYTEDELYQIIISDIAYWRDSIGGVTFSGGEALLQIDKMENLLEKLKRKGVNIIFETALFVDLKNVNMMLKYADCVYIDMKIADSIECEKIIGGEYMKYYENLMKIEESNIEYIIRIPCIKPYTFNNDNMKKIIEILELITPNKVQIFSCHSIGENKYKMCGYEPIIIETVSNEELGIFKKKIEKIGKKVEVLRI